MSPDEIDLIAWLSVVPIAELVLPVAGPETEPQWLTISYPLPKISQLSSAKTYLVHSPLRFNNQVGQLKKFISFLTLFNRAFSSLKGNDPVRMAGATAFFAFFALPPIVIILSQVLSALFNDRHQMVSGRLFGQLAHLFGPQSARQLQDISQHLQPNRADWQLTFLNGIVLLLASTTLFTVMKNSLNQLWNVKVKPDRTLLYSLKERITALAIIVVTGLLLTVSVTISQTLAELGSSPYPDESLSTDFLNGIGRYIASVCLLTTWFALLFAYLPDVHTRRSAIWVGAFVTGLLFSIGEWGLTQLLTYRQIHSLHGGAGAITLVLLFVFYCALIFYYGASFTRQYAEWANLTMAPNSHAVGYTITDVVE